VEQEKNDRQDKRASSMESDIEKEADGKTDWQKDRLTETNAQREPMGR
jgi:hypothetical protein